MNISKCLGYLDIVITSILMPIMIVNLLGGLVSGIWLACLGQWSAIGTGIVVTMFGAFFLGFAMMPGMLFVAIGSGLMEAGKKYIGISVASINFIWTLTIIGLWGYMIFHHFESIAKYNTLIPMMIWSYATATGPLSHMAQKDGRDSYAGIFVLLFEIIYIIAVLIRLI